MLFAIARLNYHLADMVQINEQRLNNLMKRLLIQQFLFLIPHHYHQNFLLLIIVETYFKILHLALLLLELLLQGMKLVHKVPQKRCFLIQIDRIS
jgi:hypothetical protein